MHVNSTDKATESIRADSGAEEYVEHLLHNGSQEGDSGAPLELPPWYDEQLFKRYVVYLYYILFLLKVQQVLKIEVIHISEKVILFSNWLIIDL